MLTIKEFDEKINAFVDEAKKDGIPLEDIIIALEDIKDSIQEEVDEDNPEEDEEKEEE